MPAPIVYTSADAGAPVLRGTAGTMINVLDACLVTGYGAKPAAGWTKPFTGTNLAAYRMGTGGTARRMYLAVDDSGINFARMRGYDDMTGVQTGTEPFPSPAQIANNGLTHWRSVTSDSTARPWVLLATPTCFYFFVQLNQTTLGLDQGGNLSAVFFGEYVKYTGAGFQHNVALICPPQDSAGPNFGGVLGNIFPQGNGTFVTTIGHYACRSEANQANSSLNFSKSVGYSIVGPNTYECIGRSGLTPVPDTSSGKGYLTNVYVVSSSGSILGHMPGLRHPINWAAAGVSNWLDTVNGSGNLSGRSYLVTHMPASLSQNGGTFIGRGLFDLVDFD